MLHTELHTIHPDSNATHAPLQPLLEPNPQVMQTLSGEMENMIVESKLKKEAPLRSAWDAAVARALTTEAESEREVEVEREPGEEGSLPSPVSPVPKPRELFANELGMGLGMGSPGRLPSPRPSPSPPPGMLRRGSSYVRARSVSC